MKCKNTKILLTNAGISILVLVVLSLIYMLASFGPPLLHKIQALPLVWIPIITILIIFGLIWLVIFLLKLTKRVLLVVSFCVLEIGFIFAILSYYKSLWDNPAYNVSVFGTGATIIALGIAFLALYHQSETETATTDKVIKDSNIKMQELITKIQIIDKIVKEMDNKMQQLNTKVQMMDKTAKDLDSKMQKLDTKIQMLIDRGRSKR
jgi:hypothetical protein